MRTTLDLRIGVQPSLVSYGIAMLATNRLGRWEAFCLLATGLDDVIWCRGLIRRFFLKHSLEPGNPSAP